MADFPTESPGARLAFTIGLTRVAGWSRHGALLTMPCDHGRRDPPEAAGPPRVYKGGVFVGGILPDEVAPVDDVKFAARQPFAQVLRVDERYDCVSAA